MQKCSVVVLWCLFFVTDLVNYVFTAYLEQLVHHALWCSCQSHQSHCSRYYLIVADTGLVVVAGPNLFFK